MSVFRSGNTALITGGSSGIGFATAELCLRHGMRVVIVDINKGNLDFAQKRLDEGHGNHGVEFHQTDVSKMEEWAELKDKVGKKYGQIDFLMLNAGVGGKGTWGDGDYFQRILSTNLFGVINGLNTFVPSFQSRASDATPSAIVITGSKQGITNPPGNPAYNASKAAVKALAEHLSFDLRNTGTGVHLLVPGWTFTGLTGSSYTEQKEKPAGAWTPTQVAEYMYQKMQEGKFYIICPDNDVSEETDKKRMLWTAGDAVEGRPPLTRWREEWKDEAQKWMDNCEVPK
ncbi:NAD(P)-binding protein [Delitschia confertaspora ATCC 74209]|uniref:NAD(P)-binding protein n=1 Tax=Delitschia confertaspora ATCC 74209 TaxID=1513339 RepID=A0A9P4MKX7_9PLEO|nr:NAD(P)-binding protein [Delitschia confertaspora ATCC 74209]